MKTLFSIVIFSILLITNVFAANFTVNGIQYTGQKFKVYPNSESQFKIVFSQGSVGRAESSNQSFRTRTEATEMLTAEQGAITVSDNKKISVFVKANDGTRINSTSKISLIPTLTASGQTDFPFFEVILSPEPSITNIELMTADIKNLQKGLPVRIIVRGGGLDDIDFELPKNIKSKVVKSTEKEMTLELSSTSKSYKGIVIDHSNFFVKSAKVKLKFDAKKLDFSLIK